MITLSISAKTFSIVSKYILSCVTCFAFLYSLLRKEGGKGGNHLPCPSSNNSNYYTLFKEGMNMYSNSSIEKRKEALKIFDLVIDLKSDFVEAYFFAFMS